MTNFKKIDPRYDIKKFFEDGNFDKAEEYINKNLLDKPEEFFSLEKLRVALGLDRRLSLRELILHAFGNLKKFKSKGELLDEEFEKFDNKYLPHEKDFKNVEILFKCFVLESDTRSLIEKRDFGKLNNHPSKLLNVIENLPEKFRTLIPEYVKDHVNLNRFMT